MFISSLHFSGLVPPCIRTDTASDYRTTFFKGPEVNGPVFCIIKVITHKGRQRLSPERGPLRTARKGCTALPSRPESCAWPDFGRLVSGWSCDGPQVRLQDSVWVRSCSRSCIGSWDMLSRNPRIRSEKGMMAPLEDLGTMSPQLCALCLYVTLPPVKLGQVSFCLSFTYT